MLGKIPIKNEELKTMKNYGLDVGTMNIVSATNNEDNETINTKSLRNMFLKVDEELWNNGHKSTLESISHVKIDNDIYILSDSAYNFSNTFNIGVSRPMKNGLISPNEINAIDVLTLLIKQLLSDNDDTVDKNVIFSIPASSVDQKNNVIYHERVITTILKSLGYKSKSLNEALAIIFAECKNTNYSAISISYGCGMSNIAATYNSIPIMEFSINRGGDWIDNNVADQFNISPSFVNYIKENGFSGNKISKSSSKEKKERQIKDAINHYYSSLIEYTISKIAEEFEKNEEKININNPIPFIVSGGTSLFPNFIGYMRDSISKYEFPFEISDIIHASNPLTAVAKGCLVKAIDIN